MRNRFLLVLVIVLGVFGCQESGYLVTGENFLKPSGNPPTRVFGANGDQFSRGLDAEIKSSNDNTFGVPPISNLPDDLSAEPLFQKLKAANYAAIHSDGQADAFGRKIPQVQTSEQMGFQADDFRHFITATVAKVGLGMPAGSVSRAEQPSVFATSPQRKTAQLLEKYLVLYYQGQFITRDGTKLSKPQLSSNIGNDAVTGFLTVVLEATYDGFYSIPVYYKKKTNATLTTAATIDPNNPKDLDAWATTTGDKPSAAVINPNLIVALDDTGGNFDIDKWNTVQFFGNVAGDQSTVISGMILKSLGHIDTGPFVVFGGISIGDNQTLGKVIDTFFQVASRRTTEALTYKFVQTHPSSSTWTVPLKTIYQIVVELRGKQPAVASTAGSSGSAKVYAASDASASKANLFSAGGAEVMSRDTDAQLAAEKELATFAPLAKQDPENYIAQLRVGTAAKERRPTIGLDAAIKSLNHEMLAYAKVPAQAVASSHANVYDANPVQADSLRDMLDVVNKGQEKLYVVNGIEDYANMYPDCVALFNDNTDPLSFGCSGVLIAPNVVLTAAHCYRMGYCNYVFVGKDARDTSTGKFYKVDPDKRFLLNPAYDMFTAPFDDLCVLVLTENVPNVTPRKIATMAQINQAPGLRIVGYGTNDAWGNSGSALRRIGDVPFLSRCCDARDAAKMGCNAGKELANGEQLHRTTCFGDSGGPLLVQDQTTKEWLIAGLTSRGLPNLPTGSAPCTVGGIDEIVDAYRAQIHALVPDAQWLGNPLPVHP